VLAVVPASAPGLGGGGPIRRIKPLPSGTPPGARGGGGAQAVCGGPCRMWWRVRALARRV